MIKNLYSESNLNKIKMKGFPSFAFLKLENKYSKLKIKAGINILDRKTKKPLTLTAAFYFSKKNIKSNKDILSRVRRTFIYLFTHEIDECLMFGSIRVFDPHKKKKFR